MREFTPPHTPLGKGGERAASLQSRPYAVCTEACAPDTIGAHDCLFGIRSLRRVGSVLIRTYPYPSVLPVFTSPATPSDSGLLPFVCKQIDQAATSERRDRGSGPGRRSSRNIGEKNPSRSSATGFPSGKGDYFFALSHTSLLTKAVRLRPSAVLPLKA